MNNSIPKKCENCSNNLCASKVPMFSGLSDVELHRIIRLTGHKSYKKGETLFLEGEASETLYILNEGQIKLSKITKDGKEQILHILTPGDFFGELSLFGTNRICNFSSFAVSDTRICILTKNHMDSILRENPDIALKILSTVSDRLAETENLAQNLATKDVEARIAYILLEFCDKYGTEKDGEIHIRVPINREEMANYAGVTRETMSRKLKKLETEGILAFQGSKVIIVKDHQTLISMTG